MSERLERVRLKIERANKHISDLDAALQGIFEPCPYEVVVQDNPQANQRQWRVNVLREVEIPPEVSLMAGDALHNLRSALDHLMTQLVKANGRTPSSDTEFPIGQSETHYKAIRSRKAKGASQAALNVIDALKPYKGGNDALWRVHQLDIVDKHRLLLTISVAYQNVILNPVAMMRATFADNPQVTEDLSNAPDMALALTPAERIEVTPGVQLFGVPLGDKTHDDVKFTFSVALREAGVVEGEPLIPTLMQLRDVVQGAIESFAPLLGK